MHQRREGNRVTAAAGIKNRSTERRRRSWTREQKQGFVDQWHRSGKSRWGFSQDEGLCYQSFLRWITRSAEEKQKSGQPEARFVRVELTGERAERCPREIESNLEVYIELVTPGGLRVRIGAAAVGRLGEIMSIATSC